MAQGFASYLDVPAYLRSASNLETASLLGLNTQTATATQPAGTTALAVASSAGWAAGPVWLLDGPASEVAQVTGSGDGTHLTLAAPGTAFAHAVGVSVSQAGQAGALADLIARASAWIEGYCRQGVAGDRSLFAASRTERWTMPSTHAHLDRDQVLVVRPGHFPVQSVSTLSIELGQGQSLAFDVSQLELPAVARTVELPYLLNATLSPGMQVLRTRGLSRARRQWVVITYSGGLTPGAVPYDVQQACAWLVSDLLGQRQNPVGAAELRLGKKTLVARLRGDVSGDSILRLQAKAALEIYKEREP
ncbi:MAG TPA: hypothetical protein VGR57_21620 [Ktedonobacterales bacterium]|nr:hypothetical protein [Ktedonobacterales bacterium]